MAWSFRRNQGDADRPKTRGRRRKESEQAVPPNNTDEFTVPSYRRGSPYSKEAQPTYADRNTFQQGKHPYDNLTAQQAGLPFGTYPPSTKPPQEWVGYKQDNYARSIRDEHVLNADEGIPFGAGIPAQHRNHPALNPYWNANIVKRIQRAPNEYSFLRLFDRQVLGRRSLNGTHFSQGQNATDNNRLALQGMVPAIRRRSTFRLDPVQYADNSVQASDSSDYVNQYGSVTSGLADLYARSFRLG